MGTDFLRNKREKHRKAWAHGMAATIGDWVAALPEVARVYRAKAQTMQALAPEQSVLLRLLPDDSVVASTDVHEVARLDDPSSALVDCLRSHHATMSRSQLQV